MTASMATDNKTSTTRPEFVVVQTAAAADQQTNGTIKSNPTKKKRRLSVAISAVLIVVFILVAILVGVKFFLDGTNQLVHRSYEFNDGNKKVEQNVTADVSNNYVEHHVQDADKQVWIVNDFNRDLQAMKVVRPSVTVCYIKQLNRSESTQPADVNSDDDKTNYSSNSVSYFYRAASLPIKDHEVLGTRARSLCTEIDVFWLKKICDVDGGYEDEALRVKRTIAELKTVRRRRRCSDTCTRRVSSNCRWERSCWLCAKHYVCDWTTETYSCCKCSHYVQVNCRYERACFLCSKQWICDSVLEDYAC